MSALPPRTSPPASAPTARDPLLLAQIVEVSGDAIFSEDMAGAVTSWNPAAERVYGISADDMLGRSAADLLPEETAEQLGSAHDTALAGERVDRFDSWHLRPDGRHIAVSLTVSPLRHTDGEMAGLATSVADVTDRVQLTAELEDARRTQDQLNSALAGSDTVATVSHELRTPLSSIAAYAEMLQAEGVLTPQQTGWVEAIARNADRLTSLTDALLRSGVGPQQAASRPIDLRDVVGRAEEVLETLGTGRAIQVRFALPATPVVVLGEAEHLERVVINLMSNAIKFSEDGGTVICTLSATDTEAVLIVTDSGIGIPEDEQAELFNRFFRGSAARDRAITGAGLGLHIVATIVHSHGGRVSVESALRSGSTFTVKLPLAPGAPNA